MKRRGSAIIYVVIFMAAITTVLLATHTLTTGVAEAQNRRENRAQARMAYEGAMNQVSIDLEKGTISAPSSRDLTLGNAQVHLELTDYSSTIPRTTRVVGAVTVRDMIYRYDAVVANRFTQQPFYFSMFSNKDLLAAFAVTAGTFGANGDVFSNGVISLTGTGTALNGDVGAVGTISPVSLAVSGTKYEGRTTIAFPSVTSTRYQTAATRTLVADVTNPTFADHDVWYSDNNRKISGVVTGVGTIFVRGNVDIPSSLTYANSASRLVVIATGTIRVYPAATTIVGYHYSASTFQIDTGATLVTMQSGAVVADQFSIGSPFTLTYDSAVWNDPVEGTRLKLPGFW